jgi:hypothetical protein
MDLEHAAGITRKDEFVRASPRTRRASQERQIAKVLEAVAAELASAGGEQLVHIEFYGSNTSAVRSVVYSSPGDERVIQVTSRNLQHVHTLLPNVLLIAIHAIRTMYRREFMEVHRDITAMKQAQKVFEGHAATAATRAPVITEVWLWDDVIEIKGGSTVSEIPADVNEVKTRAQLVLLALDNLQQYQRAKNTGAGKLYWALRYESVHRRHDFMLGRVSISVFGDVVRYAVETGDGLRHAFETHLSQVDSRARIMAIAVGTLSRQLAATFAVYKRLVTQLAVDTRQSLALAAQIDGRPSSPRSLSRRESVGE